MKLDFLQIFLLLNIFLIGIILTLAIQHAYAHFKPQPKTAKRGQLPNQSMRLPAAIREHLLEQSQNKFEAVLNRSASELEHDLNIVIERIDKQIEKFSTEIVSDETKRYRNGLDKLRQQTESAMLNAEVEIAKHQIEIEEKLAARQHELTVKLEESIAAEKTRRIEQINNSLSEAVSSFLLETLGHEVDLGAQNDYLIKMLEANKAELISGVKNEA